MNRNPDEIVSEQIESFAKWLEAPHSELRSEALAYEAPEIMDVVKQLERESGLHTPDEATEARIKSHLFAATSTAQPSRPRHSLRRILLASTSVASFLIVVVLALGFSSPTLAEKLQNVPLLNSIFRMFQDEALHSANEKGMITAVNQSTVVNGITVTVNEVFYDGIRLDIGYLIRMPESMDKTTAKEIAERIVLKEFTMADETSAGWSSKVKQMEDHLFAGVTNITLGGAWPDQFVMQAQLFDHVDVHTTWNLKIPVAKQFTAKDSQTLTPNITQSMRSQYKFEVTEVTVTPVSTTILLKEIPPDDKLYQPSYTLSDPKGKEIPIVEENLNYDENGISRKFILSFKETPEYVQLIPHMDGEAEPEKSIKISLK
ncbi:DUF4179 domain-containing protein [Brevibacillus sp. 179-C9.3 HS]|uniref:DUF4179 domain-containing protein n=1 Tax=unclassified Brevibacillus TaxID=2684853 RepID=UPI0039A1AF08